MSFKLSELLNPAPPSSDPPPPRPPPVASKPSHSPPDRLTHSPESSYTGASSATSYSHHNNNYNTYSGAQKPHAPAQEAGVGASSYERAHPSYIQPAHFTSPKLPSISSLPSPTRTRRDSYVGAPLPPIPYGASEHRNSVASSSSHTSDIAQYSSYRTPQSPDGTRRQSIATSPFDAHHFSTSSSAVAVTVPGANYDHLHQQLQPLPGGGGTPIQLAPLTLPPVPPPVHHASAPPPDRGENAFLARSTSFSRTREEGNSRPPLPLSLHHRHHPASASDSPSSSPPPLAPAPVPRHVIASSGAADTTAISPVEKMDDVGDAAAAAAAAAAEIQQPAPTQIREPSAAAPEAKMTPQAPEPAQRQPLDSAAAAAIATTTSTPIEQTTETKIKDEPLGTPMEGTPVKGDGTQTVGSMDEDTLKAIEAAKNDFGLRAGRQKAQPSIEGTPPAVTPEETKGKKRPPPKVKKGQATVKKPPTKKRKVDDASSATGRRSLSPSRAIKSTAHRAAGGSGKKSASNTPGVGSSPAPGSVISQDESAYASDGDSSDGNSNDVFCICRKGDNHTWMIACDGGCEDWFHGKCVDILEDDGELIDKYICPNCEKTLDKVTTWLPGCRNRGCRRPARIRRGDMSKYCSDKCGREFMQGELKRSEMTRKKAAGREAGNSPRSRRKFSMATTVVDPEDSEDDLGPRGSALKASELKALVTSMSGDVTAFRGLGAGVLSPPATASPTAERFPTSALTGGTTPPPSTALGTDLNASERTRLETISAEKDDLRRRRALLRDREKFGQLVRENVAKFAEREKVKPKDVCGYDNRLTWGEEEFSIWRDSEEGSLALASGTLPLPEPRDGAGKPETNGVSADKMDVDGEKEEKEGEHKAPTPTMCTKKRCERHRQWQKQALADVRFEESQLADKMRGLEAEERELREGAALRGRMQAGGMGGEGVVEVVMQEA